MSKKLIAPGIFEYSLDNLEEAKQDTKKYAEKYSAVMEVITDGQAYYGPVGENWKYNLFWSKQYMHVYTSKKGKD